MIMKRLSKLFVLLLTVLLITGCVKENVHMDIKKNGDVELSIVMAYADSISNYIKVTDEEKQSFIDAGYKVEDYVDESLKGIKVTKTYKIKDISSNQEIEVSLNDLLENPSKDITLFQKTGKGKYKANFTIDTKESNANSSDLMKYASNIDISYSVTLPSNPKSHNATSIDGNTLTWKIKYGETKNINYEFTLNNNNILWIIIGVVGIAIIAVVVVAIVMKRKSYQTLGIMKNEVPLREGDSSAK